MRVLIYVNKGKEFSRPVIDDTLNMCLKHSGRIKALEIESVFNYKVTKCYSLAWRRLPFGQIISFLDRYH